MAITLTQFVSKKRMVGIGNDQVWYEDFDMPGEFVVLTDSIDDIDTSDQLQIFECNQKGFVVNGDNLYVIDLMNSKITTDDIKPSEKEYPERGIEITGVTSGAKMIIDFCSASDGSASVYGYRHTEATFSSGETVTGTNTVSGGSVSFELNAAEVGPPHWYSWTVYANDSVYGEMPTKAYLGCSYCGSAVLAGDPKFPERWYMSRQDNPFDWLYTANDAQSAISGKDINAEDIGDIGRSLIPIRDDYLIFGCASSLILIRGRPASGGSINQITKLTGIFGDKSWCFDGYRNIFFWGANGLYKLSSDFAALDCISEKLLPNLVKNESVNPETHRVTLEYDRAANGINICITLLSDGTNSNYFYDLLTEGFFPHAYPTVCGAYSQFYYSANNPDYKGLLLGCADGYVRYFDESAKNDDVTVGTQPIDSYLTIIFPLWENEDYEGILQKLNIIISGGASDGEFTDSDQLSYALYTGNNAETVLENIIDGATPFLTGTWTTVGKQNRLLPRMRGCWAGIKLYDNTASKSWSVEKMYGDIKKKGRM